MSKYKKREPIVRRRFEPAFPPSDRMVDIINAAKDGTNIQAEAVAGSGKSTLLKFLMREDYDRNPSRRAACLMFGADAVRNIEPECAANVQVLTCHALGLRSGKAKLGFIKVDDKGWKVKSILKELCPIVFDPDTHSDEKDKAKAINAMYEMTALISKCKITLSDYSDPQIIQSLCDAYNVNIDIDLAMHWIGKAFDKIHDMNNVMDFDDMMYLAVALNWDLPKYDIIYVDESQDLNNLMIQYIDKMRHDNTQIISVGDRRQAIFGFAGSNTESIPTIIRKFGSVEMPLDVCYRCGKDIILEAQRVVPHIKYFEGAAQGEVIRDPKININSVVEGDMLLARRNASLVKPCLDLLKDGKRAFIKGRNIGEQIIKLIEKCKTDSIPEMLDNVEESTMDRIAKLLQRKNPDQNAIELLSDYKDVIEAVSEGCNTVSDVKHKVTSIFSDAGAKIQLSSIHRAKGLEADRVTIIDYDNVRINRADMSPEFLLQESNLEYVALTRAKKTLNLQTQNGTE
jgi:DNA helicase II / ATP-dependent DNA helicase PcrA